MAAPAKTINVLGALAKLETTYGTQVTATTTADGFLLSYTDRNQGAPVTVGYAFDGSYQVAPGTLGNAKRVPPSGKFIQGDLPHRFVGAGATYTTAVFPSPHVLLRASGFDATLAAAKYTYTPTAYSATYASASVDLYARGEKYPAYGVLANWSYQWDGLAPPTHTFSIKGISGAVTDVTLPSITGAGGYGLSVLPPGSAGLTLVIGSFTTNAVGIRGAFNLNRDLAERVAGTASGGHLGFVPGGRKPEFRVTVEDTAFVGSPYHTSAGLDPFLLREAGTEIACSIKFGSVANNEWTHTMSTAQLVDITPSANGPTACWDLVFQPNPSTLIATDDMSILFD